MPESLKQVANRQELESLARGLGAEVAPDPVVLAIRQMEQSVVAALTELTAAVRRLQKDDA
ncbi:MAG: hypothetical protein HY856_13600 [Burkholderiales bacterium]|nr:hypothetical protein [Burkholderiales bacterium]